MKILTIAAIPDELAQKWFQHVRDFDIAHPGQCSFTAFADAPNKSLEEIAQVLNIQPPIGHKLTIKK